MTAAGSSLDLDRIKISPLPSKESIHKFRCGESDIDYWVGNKAAKWHTQNRSKVFIAHDEGSQTARGFYSLSFSTEEGSKLASHQDRSIWSSGVPLIYLGYLAVQRSCQREGLGTLLLMNCLQRAHEVSRHVAFYGVGLRSLNEKTTQLYQKYGFGIANGEDSKHPLMILPIWTLNDLFGG
ncbi:GNAT family N-acetyltransferase [Sinorhizobium meliloti]|nr:GNAT family N-acetyltransferase [Sinorhizobium meliloti]